VALKLAQQENRCWCLYSNIHYTTTCW
jgi:hypothetical protein